jgi:hypothetical protein
VSFAAITLRVASQGVFIFVYVIDTVRKLLDTPPYKTVILPVVLYACYTWSLTLREHRLRALQGKSVEEEIRTRERRNNRNIEKIT